MTIRPALTLILTAALAGCAAMPSLSPIPTGRPAILAAGAGLPTLTGDHPFLLPGQRALAQRTNPQTPKTPFELWESRRQNGWQKPVRLFADLPSAYEPMLVADPAGTSLYFAALPPRSYVPRLFQSRTNPDGTWTEPEKLDLLEQGRGAESPDVVRTASGTWWMAYASAGPTPDVRLAKSPDGRLWQSVARLADGAHPRLAAMADGRLLLAFEQGSGLIVRQSIDCLTWQDTLSVPNASEPALTVSGTTVLLANRETGSRRASSVSWRRSSDGRPWSAPKPVAGDLHGLRWLTDGGTTALYGSPTGGKLATVTISLR